jgi:ribosomal protein S18 acetylase RimI-like enzyme
LHLLVHPLDCDDVVVYACCSPERIPGPSHVVLARFGVKPEHRKLGHGTRLLQIVTQHYAESQRFFVSCPATVGLGVQTFTREFDL